MNVRPLHDRVIIKRLDQESKTSLRHGAGSDQTRPARR